MNATARVQHGVLIRIVNGSGAHERGDETRLAAKAATRNNHRATAPSDHSGVNKDARLRPFRHIELNVRFEPLINFFEIDGTSETEMVAVEQIKISNSPTTPLAADYERIQTLDDGRWRRFPIRRKITRKDA